jgi:hypothetical protein
MKRTHIVLICWFAALFTALAFTSCRTVKPVVVKEKETEIITETVRDTVFETKADSSFYRAYIECIEGKPALKKPVQKAGNYLKPPKVNITPDNILEVDCEARAQELFAQWKEKHTLKQASKEVPVTVKEPLSGWQNFQIWAGRLFLLLLLLILLANIKRLKPL